MVVSAVAASSSSRAAWTTAGVAPPGVGVASARAGSASAGGGVGVGPSDPRVVARSWPGGLAGVASWRGEGLPVPSVLFGSAARGPSATDVVPRAERAVSAPCALAELGRARDERSASAFWRVSGDWAATSAGGWEPAGSASAVLCASAVRSVSAGGRAPDPGSAGAATAGSPVAASTSQKPSTNPMTSQSLAAAGGASSTARGGRRATRARRSAHRRPPVCSCRTMSLIQPFLSRSPRRGPPGTHDHVGAPNHPQSTVGGPDRPVQSSAAFPRTHR